MKGLNKTFLNNLYGICLSEGRKYSRRKEKVTTFTPNYLLANAFNFDKSKLLSFVEDIKYKQKTQINTGAKRYVLLLCAFFFCEELIL